MVTDTALSLDDAVELTRTGDLWLFRGRSAADQAIRIANDTKFGLAASVYSSDPDAALAVARRIRAGCVAVNLAGPTLCEPFGGKKQSGWGRECGTEGILEFTDIKQILLSGSYADQ